MAKTTDTKNHRPSTHVRELVTFNSFTQLIQTADSFIQCNQSASACHLWGLPESIVRIMQKAAVTKIATAVLNYKYET
jgi:hypothetical protein